MGMVMKAHRSAVAAAVAMLFLAAVAHAQTDEGGTVAVTIDDVPAGFLSGERCDADRMRALTRALVAGFVETRTPVTAFVTESTLCGALRDELLPELLTMWLDAGMPLGNHTFSHPDLNTTPIGEYLADVERGAVTSMALAEARGLSFEYFRHPYLHAGDTPEKHAALAAYLDENGYRVAPVTIDNQEWVFAEAYARALEAGDDALAHAVADAYVEYMIDVFAFFESWSVEVLGYDPPHVLLIHANELNVEAWPRLAARLRERGYAFASLDDVLSDPAYAIDDGFVGAGGLSWIHRWALARGMAARREPREPAWIAEAAEPSRE